MRWTLPLLMAAAPAWAVEWPECYCTDSVGARVEVGEHACLVVNGRAFLARCDKALNVTIWRETGEGCVSAATDRGLGRVEPGFQTLAVDVEIVAPEPQS